MNSREACAAAGVTYRVLDYWSRCGLVKVATAYTGRAQTSLTDAELAALPERWRNPAHPGTGTARDYDPAEVDFLKLMAAMSRSGIEPRTAARFARQLIEYPDMPVHVADGLVLKMTHCDRLEDSPIQREYRDVYAEMHGVQ